jgi:hypothetical protein
VTVSEKNRDSGEFFPADLLETFYGITVINGHSQFAHNNKIY